MPPEDNPTRRLYLEELSRKTVLVGRWSMLVGAAILTYFIFFDRALVQAYGTLPWRLFGIACCLGFLALALTHLKRDPRWAIPLYAVALTGILLSVCGVAVTMLQLRPTVPGARYGTAAGVMVTVLGLFVFASGARRHLPYIIGVPLGLTAAYLMLSGLLAPNEWLHLTNPAVAGFAVVVMSWIQEPLFYNEFKMRQLALESNAKLQQAQEVLKQAHDEQLRRHRTELAHLARLNMMGEMAANLAHELNQPFHAINNYAHGSLVRLQKMPERDEEFAIALEQIALEANRAAEIVRRVRWFIEKREPQFADVLVNNLIEEAVVLSKAALGPRCQARVVLELSGNLPVVIGDPVQVEQVIMNLVHNSLEAMEHQPEEQRLLCIKTLRHDDQTVLVEVGDRGAGIDAADRDRIFEPFFTTKPEGMGMGLAISRSIVQAHGGRLWVSANPDQGCTFHFTLAVGGKA